MIHDKSIFGLTPLDDIFLDHREGIDPRNYRVGVYNDRTYVLEPITGLIMDFYYDDEPEDFSINLKNILNLKSDSYLLYRSGKILNTEKDIILKVNEEHTYPRVQIHHEVLINVHNLLAKVFIPNPDPVTKTVVDHIDRDKFNYSLSNLRWATISENRINSARLLWSGKRIFMAYSDIERTKLVREYTDEELFNDFLPLGESIKNYRHNINNSIKDNTRSYGYYWKIIDLRLKSYLDLIGETSIDDSLWELHYSEKFYVHPLGLFKSVGSDIIRSGSQHNTGKNGLGYRRYSGILTHRLVAEVFLNGNKPIDSQLVVDHIDANPQNNKVSNLRICTQKENSNNPNSINKNRKTIKNNKGETFIGLKSCAEHYGYKSIQTIVSKINGKLSNPEGLTYI